MTRNNFLLLFRCFLGHNVRTLLLSENGNEERISGIFGPSNAYQCNSVRLFKNVNNTNLLFVLTRAVTLKLLMANLKRTAQSISLLIAEKVDTQLCSRKMFFRKPPPKIMEMSTGSQRSSCVDAGRGRWALRCVAEGKNMVRRFCVRALDSVRISVFFYLKIQL